MPDLAGAYVLLTDENGEPYGAVPADEDLPCGCSIICRCDDDYDEICRCGAICGCYGAGCEWDEDYEDTATRNAEWAQEDGAS